MMNDAKFDDPTEMDGSFCAEAAEASFPEPEEVRASYTSRSDVSKHSWRRKIAIFIVIFAFFVTIVVFSVVLRGRDSGYRSEIERMQEYLVDHDISDPSTFDDTSSPQYRAVRWLASNVSADLSIPDDTTNSTERYMYMVRYVMAVHFFALGGDTWDVKMNFLSTANVCEWKSLQFGVLCSEVNGQKVPTQIVLERRNVRGKLPAEIGKLITLEGINFGRNMLTGSIPTEICSLSTLRYIILNENMLVGSIPRCFGSLPQLIDMVLSDNMLEGNLPAELGKLKSMKMFFIDDNTLNGNPIKVFNQITSLTHLMANGNSFTGMIDSSFLSQCPNIFRVDLSHNKFTSVDEFPTSLFNTLNVLDLSKNELAGSFPAVITSDTKLHYLSLFENKLTGSVSGLASLKGIIHLDLSRNRFTASMDQLGTLTNLTFLFLSENPFSQGLVPSSFSNLLNLKELSLRNTNRNGTLPLLTKYLRLLDLGSNQFTGEIPTSYGTLSQLSYLLLNNNTGISGTIPVAKMISLRGVFLDGTSMANSTMTTLCGYNRFKKVEKKYGEGLFADCLNCSCSGCQCCPPGLKGGCSRPELGNIDASWETKFQRVKYEMRNVTADLVNSQRTPN